MHSEYYSGIYRYISAKIRNSYNILMRNKNREVKKVYKLISIKVHI